MPGRIGIHSIADIDAVEKAVLGIFLLVPDEIPRLPGDFFTIPRHRQIYAALVSLPPGERNPYTVAKRLARDGEPLGPVVAELLALITHPLTIVPLLDFYLEDLRAIYRKRKGERAINAIAKGDVKKARAELYAGDGFDPYTVGVKA